MSHTTKETFDRPEYDHAATAQKCRSSVDDKGNASLGV